MSFHGFFRICVIAHLIGCLGAEAAVGADGQPDEKTGNQDAAATQLDPRSWNFVPPHQRRDVFYDLEKVYDAKRRLAALKEEQRRDIPVDPEVLITVDDVDKAIERANQLLPQIESAMQQKDWNGAIRHADIGLELITGVHGSNPDHIQLTRLLEQFTRLRSKAVDEKLYEEARLAFELLDIRLQGILWSADQAPLAILEHPDPAKTQKLPDIYQVQDRILDCTIIAIDVNRVDFAYRYKQRRFEFRVYLEDGS